MEIIKKKIKELECLVEKYPTKLPLKAVVEFLGMNEEGLKAALLRQNTPFGFGYQKEDGGNRVFIIPTVIYY
jgi:hypothetical protein